MIAIKTTIAALFVASPLALADVQIVDPSDGVDAIQTAVDLASSGDVLLVRSGSYLGFSVENQGLTILADGAPVPLIVGTVNLLNVPAGESFVLRGFRVNAVDGPGLHEAFFARNCAGSLLIEDCTFTGDSGRSGKVFSELDGHSGVRLVNVASSIWNRCTARGGGGADLFIEEIHFGVGGGGHGFDLGNGDHALYDCIGNGGGGGSIYDTEPFNGGNGGSGVRFEQFGIVSGSELTGGYGGFADCNFIFCGTGGNGGNGIEFGIFAQVSEAWTLDNIYTPGLASTDPQPGTDGVDVRPTVGSTHVTLSGTAKHLELPSPIRVADQGELTARGEAGELALLFFSPGLDFAPNLALNGVFVPELPLRFINLGFLPESGEKTLTFTVQPIGGLDAVSIHFQALMFDGSANYLSSVSSLTIVDAGL